MENYGPVPHSSPSGALGPYGQLLSNPAMPLDAVAGLNGTAAQSGMAPGEVLTTLWVGNIPESVSAEELKAAFSPYGQVLDASLMDGLSSLGQRQGFVRFSRAEEVATALAVAEKSQMQLAGQPVKCSWAKRNLFKSEQENAAVPVVTGMPMTMPMTMPATMSMTMPMSMPAAAPTFSFPSMAAPAHASAGEIVTLWVGSLPAGTQESEMASIFGAYGAVVACVVHSKPSPQGSLSGFVRYSTRQQCELALQFANAGSLQVRGQPIVARWAKGNSKVGMGVSASNPSTTAMQFAAPATTAMQFAAPVASFTMPVPQIATGGGQILPLGWESTIDPNTGMTYYFNRATGQSSWTPPI